jgi:hypothetical protein
MGVQGALQHTPHSILTLFIYYLYISHPLMGVQDALQHTHSSFPTNITYFLLKYGRSAHPNLLASLTQGHGCYSISLEVFIRSASVQFSLGA